MRPLTRVAVFGSLTLLLVVSIWVGFRAYKLYSGVQKMTGHAVPTLRGEPTVVVPSFSARKRINFLILGSDNDRKKEEARPLTQSMILVTVDPVHYRVGMLSIPRDFWVPIRGHGMAKIMLAHKWGGVPLARYTVHTLFGVPIHHYAWVGLGGFIKVIDTFGGVTLNVTHPILDDFYPDDINSVDPYAFKRVFIPAGWQHLPGDLALEYVRSRHGDLIGDFGRSARQQQVLLQLRQHMNGLDVLLNLPTLVNDLQDSVVTDLSVNDLVSLARLSRHIRPGDITQKVLSVPDYGRYATSADGQSIVQPYWKKIRTVVKQMFAPIQGSALPVRTVVPVQPTPRATHTPGPKATSTTLSRPTAVPTVAPTVSPTESAVNRLPGNLIYVQGGNLYEITRSLEVRKLSGTGNAAMPSVSPDHRSLAYVRFGRYASDVWVRALRTGRNRRLTQDASAAEWPHDNVWAVWPSWSWDGSTIYYSTDRGKLAIAPATESRAVDLGIWSMTTSGQPIAQLTIPSVGAGGDNDVTVRPGHQQILYTHWDYLPNNQPYSLLDLKDLTTGHITQLTPPGGRVLQDAWDARGNRVVYIRRQPDNVDEIVVASLRSVGQALELGPRTVIAHGEVAQPAFSPDGRWISFLRGTDSGFQLELAPVHGGPAQVVQAAGASVSSMSRPVWLP